MFGGCCCSTGLTLDEQIAEAELMKGEQAEKTVLLRRVKTRPPPVPALNGAMDLNAVVPEGVEGGNSLIVRSPFGARKVCVTVPEGLMAGDTFRVQIPPLGMAVDQTNHNIGVFASIDDFFTPTPEVTGTAISPQ